MNHIIVDLKFPDPAPASAPLCLSLRLIPETGDRVRLEDGTAWTVDTVEHVLRGSELTPTLHLKPVTE